MLKLASILLLVVFVMACGIDSTPRPQSTFTPGAFDQPRAVRPTPLVIVITAVVTATPTKTPYATPTPRPLPTLTPTPWVKNTPTPQGTPARDRRIATVEAMLSGCGGLSENDQQRVYWSMVVAQDKAVEQAESQGRSTVDYALADLAVMTYFSVTARTLECIKRKGNKERWPIPSRS